MPTCSFEVVTPDMAREWLDLDHRNRRLSKPDVARLALAMRRGEWMSDCTDAIGLDTDGGVVNGQHRLSAIVEANMDVTMLVVREVDPDVIKVIDQGRSRTFSQWLEMEGSFPGETNSIASAVNYMYRLVHGFEIRLPQQFKPTVPQLMELLMHHKNVTASLTPAIDLNKHFKMAVGPLTAYHYAFATADAEKADEFYADLLTGEELQEGQPVYALRERWNANLTAPDNKKSRTYELLAWLVKAWNFELAGQTIVPKNLRWSPSGPRGELFPRPDGVDWLDRSAG